MSFPDEDTLQAQSVAVKALRMPGEYRHNSGLYTDPAVTLHPLRITPPSIGSARIGPFGSATQVHNQTVLGITFAPGSGTDEAPATPRSSIRTPILGHVNLLEPGETPATSPSSELALYSASWPA